MLFLFLIGNVSCYFIFDFLGDSVVYYEQQFFPDTIGLWMLFVFSFFVTLYGICYTRTLITPYITAMLCYNILEVQQTLEGISPTEAGKWFVSPDLLQSFKDVFENAVDNPLPLFILSFILACIIVWFMELVQNLVFIIGLYIIYSMLFCVGFEEYREANPILFYLFLIIAFIVLYNITRNISNYVFIALFSVTGSLMLLTSAEIISGFDLGFRGLILTLKDKNGLSSSQTIPAILWTVATLIGAFSQWGIISEK